MIDIFDPQPWQMGFGERAVLVGLLSQLRPRLAIEIGTAEGGSLRCLARHSEQVHSFDLVRSPAADELSNVTLHVGDSHVLLPKVLAEFTREGRNVDFVLIDGDHTADGVERDARDLLSSDAIRRTLIVMHDTMNGEVLAGLKRIDYAANPKVTHVELELVGGGLVFGGPFHHELWGGLGLIVVDDRARSPGGETARNDRAYELYELIAPVREALVLSERNGGATGPGAVRAALGNANAAVAEIDRLRGYINELEQRLADHTDQNATRAELEDARTQIADLAARLEGTGRILDDVLASPSWRLTAPLRVLKQLLR